MGESGTEEYATGWTKANLQKLLAVMKTSIPENDRKRTYIAGLKTMDWNKVAFPPFSPEACKEKWGQILQKMVKTRTLTELLVEAEGVISNPASHDMPQIHPELPKRPAPPNAMFLEKNRPAYLKKHPNMSRQKVFKNLIKKYQKLPHEDKAQYVAKYELANEEYTRKMQVFSEKYGTTPGGKTPQKSPSGRVPLQTPKGRHRLPNPKTVTKVTVGMPLQPPLSGYRLYCKEQRASMKGLEGNNCVSIWAQGWRDMTEKQRNTFNTRRVELMRQYNVELNEYLKDFDEEKQQQILNDNGVKRPKMSTSIKRPVEKLPGEPKMPFQSGRGIFCKKQMSLLKEEIPNSRDRFATVNKMWQDLKAVQKKTYEKEIFEAKMKYSMELQKWFETLPAAKQNFYRIHNPSKIQYLNVSQMEVYDIEEPCDPVYMPSDSEDEDITDNSEEEGNNVECDEVEEGEEEDNDVIVFEMY